MKFLIIIFLGLFNSCTNSFIQSKVEETKLECKINGIDISHHNVIDWDILQKYNFDYVFIKASEGNSFKDPERINNYKNAKKCNYKVGFYVFWRKNLSGKTQFENYKQAVKDCPADCPVVLDLEDGVRDTT